MAKKSGNIIGGWAFLIGVILALILGLMNLVGGTWATLLVLIGLVVGLFNIADEEASHFLMSGAVLIIASALGQNVLSSVTSLNNILNALLTIFVPATIIVAIRNVFSLAKR